MAKNKANQRAMRERKESEQRAKRRKRGANAQPQPAVMQPWMAKRIHASSGR